MTVFPRPLRGYPCRQEALHNIDPSARRILPKHIPRRALDAATVPLTAARVAVAGCNPLSTPQQGLLRILSL
jgi:hypothetical protein